MFNELNENATKITWAKINNGCIVVQTGEEDTKARQRVNKAGNTVYERFYKSITGTINSLSVEENKFGETQIKVGLKKGEDVAVLSFNYDSAYGRGFISQIFNVDVSKELTFNPWLKELEDGSRRTNLYLNYGRESVEYKLPEGTPELKWIETKKGKVLDPVSKINFDEYIQEKLNKFIEDNNLTYQKTEQEKLEEPLTKEEMKELKEARKKVIKEATETMDVEDFFDSM
jgi:hypothetical protein